MFSAMSDSDDSIDTIKAHELLDGDNDIDPMDEEVGKRKKGNWDSGPGTPNLGGLSLDPPVMDWGAVPVPAGLDSTCPTAAGRGGPEKAEGWTSRVHRAWARVRWPSHRPR
jgi:hypothetical protein